jgi:hypothetical protein
MFKSFHLTDSIVYTMDYSTVPEEDLELANLNIENSAALKLAKALVSNDHPETKSETIPTFEGINTLNHKIFEWDDELKDWRLSTRRCRYCHVEIDDQTAELELLPDALAACEDCKTLLNADPDHCGSA